MRAPQALVPRSAFFNAKEIFMNIYVGNLSYSTTEDELRALFAEFGSVDSAKLIMDRDSGQSKGFGFIEMSDNSGGQQAIEGLNGRDINGRALTVNKAKPREERPRGGGGRGGGGGYSRGNRY
jgi:RNA recognition motif-containing protein